MEQAIKECERPARFDMFGDVKQFHGLRGLMSWWVVCGHIAATVGLPPMWNTFAVDVFIVLSGFVIFVLLDRKKERYGVYILRRGIRLFPLYLAVMAVSIAMLPLAKWTFAHAPFSGANVGRVQLAEAALSNLPIHVLVHLPLAQGLIPQSVLPSSSPTIVGQAWSISLEWQYYLLAPLLLLGMRSKGQLVLAVAAISALMALGVFFDDAFIGNKAPLFTVGATTYLLMRTSKTNSMYAWYWGFLIASIAASLFLLSKQILLPLGLWAAAVASTRSRFAAPLSRFLTSSFLFWQGDRSYSIYIVHMIAFITVAAIMNLSDVKGSFMEQSVS
ncbi:acyltransferase family protein [Sphingomonas crocodyli]|uniref:Acyltransferase n=1 Tax=Sphingomonas crocodyli TaxID=1979270 RepID=A0A437LXU7_9SPHN|nr:acyltransferase [Sphingomonas crocodyli]RVT90184.1 acyltransferase [Sphingomonas crocodyli]